MKIASSCVTEVEIIFQTNFGGHMGWTNEVNKGECGPQMKKCLLDVITELGDLNKVAIL
jgi:hypothetical protein